VFSRAAKDIALAAPLRRWLGVAHDSIDGEGLVRLLLAAPVDLLWLGGIGTYVKAGSETHEQVGDRANDAVRVDGGQLRAKVVGEGANLGFTQKGRIEFALAGGRINLDAVDNSAGVDLSDHEVNLKILMAGLARQGLVDGGEARDVWLREVADEVCGQVLFNNNRQSLCLSLDLERCRRDAEPFLDVAGRLENAGLLDRAAESFPAPKEVLARPGQSLARPELAVLMLHSKLALKQALLDSPDFLAAPFLGPRLAGYFPAALRARFAGHLAGHPLAREITATALANAAVNQAGCGFLSLAWELDAAALAEAVQAYLVFDAIVGGQAVRDGVHEREDALPAERQQRVLLGLEDALAGYCRWALAQGQAPGPAAIPAWQAHWRQYLADLGENLAAPERADCQAAEREGWAAPAALFAALPGRLGDFPWQAQLAEQARVPLAQAARRYRAVAEHLGLARIEASLGRVALRDPWERRVRAQLQGRFRLNLARLARALLEDGQDAEAFFTQRGARRRLERLQRAQRELAEAATVSILPYAALGAELDGLVEYCLLGQAWKQG
jgi:glutamate dehydrogenase